MAFLSLSVGETATIKLIEDAAKLYVPHRWLLWKLVTTDRIGY
jgi:hypothetical protein